MTVRFVTPKGVVSVRMFGPNVARRAAAVAVQIGATSYSIRATVA